MERRIEPRIEVDLSAAMVNDRILPIGCRVSNVSISGLMLSHRGYDKKNVINEDDAVEVRISLKQEDVRKILRLPLTIIREDTHGFAGKFPEPQPDLVNLFSPYLVSDNDSDVYSDTHDHDELDADDNLSASENKEPEKRSVSAARSWLPAMATVLIAGILATLYLQHQIAELNTQVATLESRLSAINLAGIRATSEKLPNNLELQQFTSRLELILNQIDNLDHRIFMLEFDAKAQQPLVDPKNLAGPDQNGSGQWIINLVSLNNESAAVDFTAKAKIKGIPAVLKVEMTADSKVWRVQVQGFTTRGDAASYSDRVVKDLGLKTAWVFQDESR